jgi:hypothetical protein
MGLRRPRKRLGVRGVIQVHHDAKETSMDRACTDQPLHLPPDQHGIVIERRNGVVHTHVPHLVVHHSLHGFACGYGGSGPADLALNIVEWHLQRAGYRGERLPCFDGTCFLATWHLHQPFKWDFLAKDHDAIRIPLDDLAAWVAQHHRPEPLTPRHRDGFEP